MTHGDINFWIHRLIEEKTSDLQKLSCEISLLNHQAQHYGEMASVYKIDCLNLIRQMVAQYKLQNASWQTAIDVVDVEIKKARGEGE